MSEKVTELSEEFGIQLLIQPRAQFFREAYCAAAFGALRQADFVRLVYPNDPPDFELQVGSTVEAFELVEADVQGRRRDRELSSRLLAGSSIVHEPEDEWLTPAKATAMLEAACLHKADGRYDKDCRLLIWLNPSDYGVHQRAIEATMRPATAVASQVFAQVWVIWKGQAHRAW